MNERIPARLRPGSPGYDQWGETPCRVAGRTVASGLLRVLMPYAHSKSGTVLLLREDAQVERLDGLREDWLDVQPTRQRPMIEPPFYVQLAPLSERIDADWHDTYSK